MDACSDVFSVATVDISCGFMENFQDPAIVLSYLEHLSHTNDNLNDIGLVQIERSIRVIGSWVAICSLHDVLKEFLLRHQEEDGTPDGPKWEGENQPKAAENHHSKFDDVAKSSFENFDETSSSREDAPVAILAETSKIYSACVDSTVSVTPLSFQNEFLAFQDAETNDNLEERSGDDSLQNFKESAYLRKLLLRATAKKVKDWEFSERVKNSFVPGKLDKCPEPVVIVDINVNTNKGKAKKSIPEIEQILHAVYKTQNGSTQISSDKDLSNSTSTDSDQIGAPSAVVPLHADTASSPKQQEIVSKLTLGCAAHSDQSDGLETEMGSTATDDVSEHSVVTGNLSMGKKTSCADQKSVEMTNCVEHSRAQREPMATRSRGRSRKTTDQNQAGKLQDKKRRRLQLLECDQCPYSTVYSTHMHEHQQRLHWEKELKCKECGKAYSYIRDLKRHEKTHRLPQSCCDICGKMYKGLKSLDAHRKTHDDDYVKPKFQCEVCHKAFSTKYALAHHIKSEHLGVKKSYVCPQCGKSLSSRHSYIQHAAVHLEIRPYKCEVCGKRFSYERSLHHHMFTHDETRHFTCPVCNKQFRQSTGLTIHMRIHKGTRDYMCSWCGKGFTQRQALLRHERTHRGDKPFQCLLCQRAFADSSVLRRHMILIHKKDRKKWQEDTTVRKSSKKLTAMASEVMQVLPAV